MRRTRACSVCKLGQGDGRYRLEIESAIRTGPEPAMPLEQSPCPHNPDERMPMMETKHSLSQDPPKAPEPPGSAPASRSRGPNAAPNLNAILSIPVTVQVVLGSTTLPVASLMKLARGAVISLDQRVGDPVDIVVNGKSWRAARSLSWTKSSQRFGVSLLEIVACRAISIGRPEDGKRPWPSPSATEGAVFQRPGKGRRPASDAGRAGGGAASEALRPA